MLFSTIVGVDSLDSELMDEISMPIRKKNPITKTNIVPRADARVNLKNCFIMLRMKFYYCRQNYIVFSYKEEFFVHLNDLSLQ